MSNSDSKRQAYCKVTMELLHALLMLPPDVRIRSMQISPKLDGATLVLQGDGLPERCEILEGSPVMQVTPQYEGRVSHVEFPRFDGWEP